MTKLLKKRQKINKRKITVPTAVSFAFNSFFIKNFSWRDINLFEINIFFLYV